MNKELLLKTADVIEANPQKFDMLSFVGSNDCGTTACIAGWAVALDKNIPLDGLNDGGSISELAAKALQISALQARNLFNFDRWLRKDLRWAYAAAVLPKDEASIAANYVRWFVATDGGQN